MAVKFYGACEGAGGDFYDLWLSVVQNDYNAENNKSNITVGLYIKKKDFVEGGVYSDSVANRARLIVGGYVVVDETFSIDTRSGEALAVAMWTGYVKNNNDGSLNLTVEGAFSLDEELGLSGRANALYKHTQIPKATTLGIDASVVKPGDELAVSFDSASSEYSHRIAWGLGTQSVSVNYEPGVLSASFAVPVEWAREITSSQKGDFMVAIRTYNNQKAIGTNVYTLDFVIPETDEYKPDFEIRLKKLDEVVPDEWNVWVQGVSKMEVIPENLSFKYGANLSAITITVGSVSKRSLPAAFDLPENGNVTVTLAVRDSRGMLTVKRSVIEVEEYDAPSVNIKRLFRCDADGSLNSSGESLFMDCIVGHSSLKGHNSCNVVVKYRSTDFGSVSEREIVTGNPFVFGAGNIKNDKSYVVTVIISDDINTTGTEAVRFVSNGDIPFNIRKGGNGAAFGKYAKNENELSVKWNLSVDGDLDFNGKLNYESVGCECTSLGENLFSDIRYYPCLGMVFLRMRFTTTMLLSENETHYVATVSDRKPGLFMPLNSVAEFSAGGQSTAGITYKNGVITFRSDTVVPQGTTVYISGFYVADYSA